MIARFLRSSLIYASGDILGKLLGLVLLPLYTSYLTAEDYGVISLIGITYMFAQSAVFLNIPSGMFIHNYHIDERRRMDNVLTALGAVLAIAAVGVLAMYAVAPSLSRMLYRNEGYAWMLRLASVVFFSTAASSVARNVLRIRFREGLFVASGVANLLLSIGLNVLFVVVLRKGVAGVIVAGAIVGAASTAASLVILYPYIKGARFEAYHLREAVALGAPIVPMGLAAWALMSSGGYFLTYFGDTAEVGVFSLANKFGIVMQVFFMAVLRFAWKPHALTLMGTPEFDTFVERSTKFVVAMGALLCLGISGLAPETIRIMAGNEEFHRAAGLVPVVAFGYFLSGVYYIGTLSADVTKRSLILSIPLPVAALVSVGLNFALVPRFGVYGAAISMAASYALAALIMFYLSHKTYPLKLPWGRMIYCVALAAALYASMSLVRIDSDVVSFLVKGVSMTVLFFIGLVFGGVFTSNEWKSVKIRLERARRGGSWY